MTRTRTIPKDESEKAAGRKPEVMLRIVSAVVLAALALAATWFSPWSFLVLVMVGGGLIAWEWGRLTRGNGFDGTALISAVAVTAVAVLGSFRRPDLALFLATTFFTIWSGFVSSTVGRPSVKNTIVNGRPASFVRSPRASSRAGQMAVPPCCRNPSTHFTAASR